MPPWKRPPPVLANAASRRCAISFPIWKKPASGRIRPRWRMPRLRAAVAEAARRCAGIPLLAGGKSFGGRMTSQAHGRQPARRRQGARVLRLSSASGRQAFDRIAQNTSPISKSRCCSCRAPATASLKLPHLEPVANSLGPLATLHLAREADHSFHVLARSGRNDREVMAEILDAFAAWVAAI